MRLLVVTQTLDTEIPALGFFVHWVEELARRVDSVTVICLQEGAHELPENVSVYSLGKERGRVSGIRYALRFIGLIWKLRHEYDTVFVHMNQEYVLLGWKLWWLTGKPVYLWRNHYAGSWVTDLAALFSTKVFYTSAHSYTAKYKKAVVMPVGVDTGRFTADSSTVRTPRSILFLGRIAPSKRPDMFIEALGELLAQGVSFVASAYGSSSVRDAAYYESLQARAESLGLHDRVRFYPGIPNEKAAAVYQAHEIFVNCSPSGMFDKTIFEAAASGCITLATSADWQELAGPRASFTDSESLAQTLAYTLAETSEDRALRAREQEDIAASQSLTHLADALVHELSSKKIHA